VRYALLAYSIHRALADHNMAEIVAINAKQMPAAFDRRPENEEAKSDIARKLSEIPDHGCPGGQVPPCTPFV
jgi:hypothetical protein